MPDNVQEVLQAFARGELVVVTDDEDREGEGDLIVATADLLSDVGELYAAGASYVTVTRLSDAHELFTVIEAAQAGLLADKRAELDARLGERREVLP